MKQPDPFTLLKETVEIIRLVSMKFVVLPRRYLLTPSFLTVQRARGFWPRSIEKKKPVVL
jgi:hypothetical protein